MLNRLPLSKQKQAEEAETGDRGEVKQAAIKTEERRGEKAVTHTREKMVLRRPGAGGAGEGGDRRGREKRGGTCDVSATAKKALLACVLVGASSAVDPGIPADYVVLHANVVMRHGQRSRLVKTTTQEFGDNDGVAVSLNYSINALV